MAVLREGFVVEEHEPDFADVAGFLKRLSRAGNGDLRCLINRVSVGAG